MVIQLDAKVETELAQAVTDWLNQQAQARSVSLTVHPNAITANGNWLHVPVALPDIHDAYDRAVALQQIEDAWNDAPPIDGVNLSLVPAKHSAAVKQERYEKMGELVARQQQLLARVSPNGDQRDEGERFQAIRREWEETLDEMTHLFPPSATEVA